MSSEHDDKMAIWGAMRTPPESALRRITGGRLAGMTDICPQWRLEVMTRVFGPCGIGWRYEVDRFEILPGARGEQVVMCYARLWYRTREGTWSKPVPGIGGSMLITAEKEGLHTNDEAYKMALTDALSVAMKAIGVGADVYLGRSPTKYASPPPSERLDTSPPEPGMPVPPTTQIGAAIKAQHSADQWASRDDEEHVLRDQIIKEARVQKEGTKRDGAPWTMYAITLGDGTTLSTFSRRVYELAQAAAETGDKVWVRYKTDPKGRVTVIDAGFPEISTPDLEPIPF